MLSKSTAQFVRSLHQKKYRQQEQCFLVEGAKSVLEVLQSSFRVELLIATDTFLDEHFRLTSAPNCPTETVGAEALARLGTLESNNAALAVVRMRPNLLPPPTPGEWILVLDEVRDPGNLGTILRIADWYGLSSILCSAGTAEVYNPKVISASKGSFTRVNWWYGDVGAVLATSHVPVFGAFLDGHPVHQYSFGGSGGYVVMGNEATGIGPLLAPLVSHRLTIPRYGAAESLNVGVATAIILDNLRRSQTAAT